MSGDNLRERMKKGKSGNLVRSRECRACASAKNKKNWAEGRNRKSRDAYLKQTYGITQEQYDEMLEVQGGVCATCKKPPKPGQTLHVDHDHRCCPRHGSCGKCIRGLLCRRCNLSLGYVDEDVEVLIALAGYLTRGLVPSG